MIAKGLQGGLDWMQIGLDWLLTGFYGHPEAPKKYSSWELLKCINADSRLPSLCFGYFNEITCHNEKRDGGSRPHMQMQAF